MPTTISSEYAIEKSTFMVTAAFIDSAGAAVAPNVGLAWKLTDRSGTVINSRTSVVIAPAASVDIVLSGDDLAMQTGEGNSARRVVTIMGTYNSTEGSNLPIKDECVFTVRNLIAVT